MPSHASCTASDHRVVGVSGSSKSSTINTLFKTSLPVSHTVACTKQFEANELTLRMTHGQATGHVTKLVVYDAPGLGEDVRKDPEYLEMYREYLPRCDMILWVTSARTGRSPWIRPTSPNIRSFTGGSSLGSAKSIWSSR